MNLRGVVNRRFILRALMLCTAGSIAIVLLGAFLLYHSSFESRFRRSRPALEAYAAQVRSGDPSTSISIPPRIGEFRTTDAERLAHGFLFFCDYGNPFDANGIAYSTEPLPENIDQNDYFTHVDGNWYSFWRAGREPDRLTSGPSEKPHDGR